MNTHVTQPRTGSANPLSSRHVVVHTDGACIPNPGPGGWAAVIRMWIEGEMVKQMTITGKESATTNQRMEMMAAIKALEAITPRICAVTIISDSQYLVKGMTEWMEGWKRKGWKNSKKKPVENRDLWERLDELRQRHGDVRWEWVKGHNGDPMNEEVDMLANGAAIEAEIDLAAQYGRGNEH